MIAVPTLMSDTAVAVPTTTPTNATAPAAAAVATPARGDSVSVRLIRMMCAMLCLQRVHNGSTAVLLLVYGVLVAAFMGNK
jgi:hypothetical protein